ncbi:MAG: type II/IV secretion system ATPase subunit [Candidatus Altiarchaeia archaeon]
MVGNFLFSRRKKVREKTGESHNDEREILQLQESHVPNLDGRIQGTVFDAAVALGKDPDTLYAGPVETVPAPGFSVDSDILAELAGDMGITDAGLLQEVLSEIAELRPPSVTRSMMEPVEKLVTEYNSGDMQKVAVRRTTKGDLLYEASEPVLSKSEKNKLKLAQDVFDKFIGVDETVVAHGMDDSKLEQDMISKSIYLRQKFDEINKLYNLKMSEEEKEKVFYYVERDFLKFGRLDILMNDKHIEDISCNGHNIPLYLYHREYGSIRTNIKFEEKDLNEFILRLSQLCGKHISILNPISDASLPDGSRINMTLGSEVTKKGSSFTIRKFKKIPISPVELMLYGSVDSKMLAYIWMIMDYGRSYLVSGGTASGKTTLLNAVCMFIKPQHKVVSIEDTPEINLEHPNWLQAVSRTGFGGRSGGGSPGVMPSGMPSGMSGGGAGLGNIGLFDLLVAALRQRPEYIIVGEVRGSEAFTMFQAIAVGHACMGTIHARNMTELIGRVESVPMNVPRTLFSNVDLVVFVSQIKDGEKTKRRIIEMVEVLEMDPTTKALITNPVFRWDPKTDKFEGGRYMLFDKIATEFGISVKVLHEEHQKRVKLLEWLKNNNVKQHVDVTRQLFAYSQGILKDDFLRQ